MKKRLFAALIALVIPGYTVLDNLASAMMGFLFLG